MTAALRSSTASGSTARKSTRTRERILEAAAHVLSRDGYAETRLSEIASRANCQAPAIYYYFDSREDLIEEVIWLGVHRVHVQVTEVVAALPADTTPLERLLTAIETHLRYVLSKSEFTTASIRNAGQMPRALRTRQLEEEQRYSTLWRTLFDDARKHGEIDDRVDLRLIRMLVLGALNWTPEWWQEDGESLDVLVTNVRILVERGIARPTVQGNFAD